MNFEDAGIVSLCFIQANINRRSLVPFFHGLHTIDELFKILYSPLALIPHIISVKRTERRKEPPVLSALVSLLKCLLDVLLGILSLRNFLESVVGDGTLETFQLECVTGRHDVVVVDDLDERLDL